MTEIERLVLDTSAYSNLRRGHTEVVQWMADAAVIYVPAVVLGELHAGFARGTRREANEGSLTEFLREPFVTVASVTHGVARHYGRLLADLRSRGTTVPTNDLWIAATTIANGGHLLTFDSDFERIARLDATVLEAN